MEAKVGKHMDAHKNKGGAEDRSAQPKAQGNLQFPQHRHAALPLPARDCFIIILHPLLMMRKGQVPRSADLPYMP